MRKQLVSGGSTSPIQSCSRCLLSAPTCGEREQQDECGLGEVLTRPSCQRMLQKGMHSNIPYERCTLHDRFL